MHAILHHSIRTVYNYPMMVVLIIEKMIMYKDVLHTIIAIEETNE